MNVKKTLKAGILLIFVSLFPALLYPAVTATINDLTIENQGILPNSGPTAILGINITGTGGGSPVQYEKVTSIVVTFTNLNSSNPFTAASHLKEVSLYRDDGSHTGYFDTVDNKVVDGTLSWNTATFSFPSLDIPSSDTWVDAGNDFYIVIKTQEPDTISGHKGSNDTPDMRMKFRASVYSITYTQPYTSPTFATVYPGISTKPITCEADMTDLLPLQGFFGTPSYFTARYPRVNCPIPYQYLFGQLRNYRAGAQDHALVENIPVPELMGMNYCYRVFGLHLAGRSTYAENDNEYVKSIKITFEDSDILGNFNAPTDLASHPLAPYPNVSFWRDTDRDGVFNPTVDTLIPIDNDKAVNFKHAPIEGSGPWVATLTYENWQFPLDKEAGNTYFLVISTTPDHGWVTGTPYYGADFKVYIDNPGDIEIKRGCGTSPAGSVFSTDFINLYKDKVKDVHAIFDLKPFASDPAEADGVPVSIFAINMCDSRDAGVDDALEWIRVWFKGTGGFKPNHLAPLADSPNSGVSLWKDNKTSGDIGVPDPRYISAADMLQGNHNLSIADTYVPLSADSLEWYNSDGTKWSPKNDDPINSEDKDKRYYVILKPKSPIPLYDDDYFQDPLGTQNKGFDYFICVKARGVSVPETGYKSDSRFQRGIDYHMHIDAAIGLTHDNDNGCVSASVNSNEPWKDIQFSTGFKARVFSNNSEAIEASTPPTTVPTFFTNLTSPGETVNYYEKRAVIGINLVAPYNTDVSFDRFAFLLIDEGDQNIDFAELVDPNSDQNNPDGGCGIALYQDNPSAGIQGVFDPADKRVWMTERPELQRNPNDPDNWRRVILHLATSDVTSPIHTVATVPTTDSGPDLGPDYFLVIQPNQFMDAGDDFSIMLWGSDILGEMDDTIHFIGDATGITYKRVKTYTLTNSTVSSTTLTDTIPLNPEVDIESEPISAIGIDVYDPTGTNELLGTRVYFNQSPTEPGLTPDNVLAPVSSNNTSGISIWVDTNDNGILDSGDTHIPMQVTTWKDDLTYGHIIGLQPSSTTTELKAFKSSENIYWLDYDKNGIWNTGDSLWKDNNGDGIYNSGDTLICGTEREGAYGVNLHDYVYGFAYYDADENDEYNDGDGIYFLGRGRNRFGWFIDINLTSTPTLPAGPDNKPDFFIVFRTGSDAKWRDEFSFTLPSNAVRFTSGISFATENLTTSPVKVRIPVFLTDMAKDDRSLLQGNSKKVIKIEMYDSAEDIHNYLTELNLYITGDSPFSILKDLTTTSDSGVLLYDKDEKFIQPTSISLLAGNRVRLQFPEEEIEVPNEREEGCYYIVLNARKTAPVGSRVDVEIRSSLSAPVGEGMVFSQIEDPTFSSTTGKFIATYVVTGTRPAEHRLIVNTSDGGTVTDPGVGTYYYGDGEVVGIKATPVNSRFKEWVGDTSTVDNPDSAETTITMHGDYTITATFEFVTLNISAGAGGNTNPSPRSYRYPPDTSVSISAIPDPGYKFVGWTGTGVDADKVSSPGSANTTIIMDGDYGVVANFEEGQQVLTISSGGNGTTNPSPGTYPYNHNTSVSISAIPDPGYRFVGWTGTGVDAGKVSSPESANTTIIMDGDYGVVANFGADDELFAIIAPSTGNKCRGITTIRWNVSGVVLPDQQWKIEYWDGTVWTEIVDNYSSRSYDWDTTGLDISSAKVRVTAKGVFEGSDISRESGTFLIDNTPPDVSIDYIPTVEGRNGAGWYCSHNAPITVKITITDANAGVKPTSTLKYQIDGGSEIYVSAGSSASPYTHTFTDTEGTTIKVWAYDAAVDKNGYANEKEETHDDYKIDLTPPTINININYGARTFTLDVTDTTSGVKERAYSFDRGDTWSTYSNETDIPDGTEILIARALDNAGNRAEKQQSFSSNRKIIGYVKDYKGTALRNITVLLCGTENKTTTTDASGYYEFTGLYPLGYYFVSPLLKNNLPSARLYNGLNGDKANQNFVVNSGWLRGGYDRGNTRNYYFASSSVLTPMVITEKYSISNTGDNMLTGVLNTTDNKMDIVFTDGSALRSYYYTGSSYASRWSAKGTTYNLTLLDGIQTETALDSMLLCGTGDGIAQVYKNGIKVKEITTSVLTSLEDLEDNEDGEGVISQSVPPDTEWSSISAGGGSFIFTGAGTNYNKIFLYNTLADTTVWETTLSQAIIPKTEVLCLREAGKAGILVGSTSDTDDLTLTAIDLATGHSLWTKVFSGIRGKITPLVAPTEEGGWDDVIAVRTSTNDSSGAMQVYVLDGATGVMKKEWVAPSTPGTNTIFSAAIADMDNNRNNDLVISDGSGNIYVVNLSSGALTTSSAGAGKVWAVVDFDGKADKKEVIVSSGTELKVLDSDLKVLASRDMEENILNVVLGQTVGDGRIDIIVSLPSKTSIVRAGATADLPGKPVIADIYSSGGKVYLVWTYTSPTGVDLSGFHIYRSSDGTVWKLIKTVAGDITSTTDRPSDGTYSYKVGAYNDYGEVLSNASEPVEVISEGGSSSSASCFIATAAYGSSFEHHVYLLRQFRDRYLLTNPAGSAFVRWYYRHSPKYAAIIAQNEALKTITRAALAPVYLFALLCLKGLILPLLLLFSCSILLFIIGKKEKTV